MWQGWRCRKWEGEGILLFQSGDSLRTFANLVRWIDINSARGRWLATYPARRRDVASHFPDTKQICTWVNNKQLHCWANCQSTTRWRHLLGTRLSKHLQCWQIRRPRHRLPPALLICICLHNICMCAPAASHISAIVGIRSELSAAARKCVLLINLIKLFAAQQKQKTAPSSASGSSRGHIWPRD